MVAHRCIHVNTVFIFVKTFQGVSLVVSFTSNSPMLLNLAKKKGSVLFPLGTLSLPDRKEIVRKELEVHGKKLSDSAFNNQVSSLEKQHMLLVVGVALSTK